MGAEFVLLSPRMANTINIPRPHLIMALCLPLAVLLGYFLAEPMDSGSLAVVVFVLAVISVPLMMKWHYPLLLFSWNAAICPMFLPGQPQLWMLMAVVALLSELLITTLENRLITWRPNTVADVTI